MLHDISCIILSTSRVNVETFSKYEDDAGIFSPDCLLVQYERLCAALWCHLIGTLARDAVLLYP